MPPPETNDRVGSCKVSLAENLPAKCRDFRAFSRFGVGNLREQHLLILVTERITQDFDLRSEDRWVHDKDLLDPVAKG